MEANLPLDPPLATKRRNSNISDPPIRHITWPAAISQIGQGNEPQTPENDEDKDVSSQGSLADVVHAHMVQIHSPRIVSLHARGEQQSAEGRLPRRL